MNNRSQVGRKLLCALWLRVLALALALAAGGRLGAATCTPAPAGLLGWWPGDGNANDVVGANPGVLQGGATANAAGLVGLAFSFDGTSGYVQINDAPALHPANLTIEAWVRFASLDSAGSGGAPAGDQYIVFKQNSQNGDFEGFDLSKTRIGASDYFRFLVSSGSGQSAELESTTAVAAGVWYHVAGVRGSNFTQLFVNGQLEAQTNVNFAQDYGVLPLFFGTSGQAYWDRKLNGQLDEVALYGRALAAGELAASYAAGAAGKCKAPAITSQPTSQAAVLGSNAVFSVAASGLAPLRYQWQFNGISYPGATNTNLALANVQTTDGGGYTVIVTNSLGSITSAVASLTVLLPPGITAQPQSRTNITGTPATFSVTATGSLPLSYQWQLNAAGLAGATGTSLTLNSVQAADAGNYRVAVSNAAGALTSSVAVLTVLVPPTITNPPQSRTNIAGTTATFSAAAIGTAPLSYQWQFNGVVIGAATGSNLSLGNVQSTNAGNYSVVITNVAGAATSAVAVLTVWVPPTVTGQPQSRTNITGTTAGFNVSAAGTAPLSYQWQFNAAAVAGATGSSLSLGNVQPTDAGNYAAVITNAAGAATSTVAVLTVWVPPAIGTQPQSQTNVAGTTAAFSVTATGTAPLSYQWQFNGASIGAATGSSLSLASVQPANAGNYSVVITNVAGTATSGVAGLTVLVPPAVTGQPLSATNLAGTTARFSVGATGTAPLGYQWQFNAAAVLGATGSSLSVSNVQPADAGNYAVVITNAAGGATSAVAVLTVWVPPAITGQPQSRTNIAGTAAAFSVTATGTAPLSYQWEFNGASLGSATASSLSLNPVQPGDAGNYAVIILNPAGSVTSAVAALTVLVPPAITSQPQSRTNLLGKTAVFSVIATGSAPLSYQWQFNGTGVVGATDSDLVLGGVQPSDAGNYAVVITNAAGAVTSAVATLTVWVPPTLTAQPQSRTNIAGTTASFTVTATGTAPLSYQWQFGGADIAGATAPGLAISNVQPSDAGSYRVVVTNSAGTATSGVAVLAVLVPPLIVSQPTSRTNVIGTPVSFSVGATGSGPLSYQWQFEGSAIAGATASDFTFNNAQPTNAGAYTVIVTNLAGAATSAVASLTLLGPAVITIQPESRTNLAGTVASFSVAATGTAPLSYQWQFNGADLAGATQTLLTLTNVQPANAGNYTVVVTNLAAATTSVVAVLTVVAPPSITAQPQSRTNIAGTTATFNTTAIGTAPLIYQWQLYGLGIAGATAGNLTLTNVQTSDAGDYTVLVTNVAGALTSSVATLTVLVPPAITAQPQSRTNLVGTTAVFSVTATGTAPLAYQWQFSGSNVAGATGSALALTNVQIVVAGNYAVVVTNMGGALTSATAVLTVLAPPFITSQPQSRTNLGGTATTFSVVASGTPPPAYQWRLGGLNLTNGGRITGVTSPDLIITNIQPADAGAYTVRVTNQAGAVTSAVASLTYVVPPPPCSAAVPGLAGWWPGDGSANDVVGGGNGILLGGATAGAAGISGSAFSFDGANGYVQIPDAPVYHAANLTVEAWVRFTSLDSTGSGGSPAGEQYLVFKQNSRNDTFEGFDLGKERVGGSDYFRFMVSSASAQSVEVRSVTTVATGVWYHVAGVRGANSIQFYLNGVLESQATVGFAQDYGALPLYFGTSGTAVWDHKFSGLLDEVSFYNRALASNEISAIYAAGVSGKCKAPAITVQPQSLTLLFGTNATFTVAATGLGPLRYQWRFNGTNLPAGTNTSLTLANIQPTDGGNYTVTVSNTLGVATSAVAVLTVLAAPAMTLQPASRTNVVGTLAGFSAAAFGLAPLSYQWRLDGLEIVGASSTNLTLANVQPADAGSYTVVVTNSLGSVTSAVAALTIWTPPVVSAQPLNQTNLAGTTATFNAAATGTAPLGYSWQFNGVKLVNGGRISGAATNALVITNVQAGDVGGYTMLASNAAGMVTSLVATLTVLLPPAIVSPPQNLSVVQGSNALFNVTAAGTQPLAYQWQFNGAGIPGANGSAFSLPGVQTGNAGSFTAVVTNSFGAVTSAAAVLAVLVPPTITSPPGSTTNAVGATATFSATAAGTLPLAYQWRFNGLNLTNGARVSGAGSTNLAISGLQPGDQGTYSLVASNLAGIATSSVAGLTVVVPPAVVTPPANQFVVAGAAVSFAVAVSGTAPLSYHWQRNGTYLADGGNVSGATSAVLHLANVGTNDAASYTVEIANFAGTVTSPPAALTVSLTPVLPVFTLQPAAQIVVAGTDVSLTASASGTMPLGYQWRKDAADLTSGGNTAGATSSALAISAAQTSDTGEYQVVVSNSAGAVTSSVAALTVTLPAKLGADAAVLVNSASANYLDFQHYLQPYLENFGVPYTVLDLATNGVGTNVGRFAILIVGHKQLDTNHTFLSGAVQGFISAAVSNGAGLVNFDSDLVAGTNSPRYQFVQDIFGFSYGTSAPTANVSFPPTEGPSLMHYITARHGTNESLVLSNTMSVAGLTLASNTTAVAFSGGRPFLAVQKFGQGRAVQWASYDWMSAAVLGPVNGLDDLVWRGLVWAARKPFVMRGLPNFAVMRIDDCAGPFNYVHAAVDAGFRPFLALFINDIASAYIPDLRSLVTNGFATASIHSFTGSTFFYSDHQHLTNYSDEVMSNNFYIGTQWYLTNGIPFGKNVIAHYSEIGPNAYPGLKAWGVEFVPIEVVPGTIEYGTPPAPWLVAGPYRRYETPRAGSIKLPLYYADFLTVPGHPELDGQFFDRYTEVRDTAIPGQYECGEWCPSNDVNGSTNRATTQLKRAFDSLVLSSLFGHEWYIQNTPSVQNGNPISAANWRAILSGITNNLAPYKPIFVTTEYGDQYVRATRTSKLIAGEFDLASGQVLLTFSGKTDLGTVAYIYVGADNQISNLVANVPIFSNATSLTITGATLVVPPVIVSPPLSRTVPAGSTISFLVGAGGVAPLAYQWIKNGTNLLTDGSNLTGTASPTLTLGNVLGADAGAYTVVITNVLGSVSSAPAFLAVNDPVIFAQPFSRTNHAGSTATFTVGVRGTSPVFQWLKNGVPANDATNPSLVLPAVSDPDAGTYAVLVSNAYNSLVSSPAALSVASPLLIQSVAWTDGVASISWSAIPGLDYTLQWKNMLDDTNWTDLLPPVRATGPSATATNSGAAPQGFYRVFLVP